MSSSYLLNLKINQLQQEIEAIGFFTGYYWRFATNGSIAITGYENDYTATAPVGNNTAYAISSVTRTDIWSITYNMDITNTNNMAVGITSDPTTVYPSPGTPSTKSMYRGLVMDYNNGNRGLFKVENGQFSAIPYQLGSQYKISYNGTEIQYSINGILLASYPIPNDKYYLIVSSVYGGVVKNITFDGSGGSSGGGGGTVGTLQEVLQTGNSAGGQTILDAGGIGTTNLEASVEVSAPLISIINSGSSYPVIDTFVNPPFKIFSGENQNFASPLAYSGQPKSFIRFDLGTDIYSSFTCSLQTFQFTMTSPTTGTQASITADIFLSSVLDGAPQTTSALDIAYVISQNLNPNGGNPNFYESTQPLLSLVSSTPSRYLYLNFLVRSSESSRQWALSNIEIKVSAQSSPGVVTTIFPTPLV